MGAKNFAIGLAITIIFPCVVHYGVVTFSPAGKYYTCPKEMYVKTHLSAVSPAEKTALEQEYDKGRETFNRHLFYVAVPLGILVIAAGLVVPVPGMGSGFMFAGLLTLLYGFFLNWSELPSGVRFASLLFGLVLFIIIGWVKYRKKEL
jgi:hypothetical protein